MRILFKCNEVLLCYSFLSEWVRTSDDVATCVSQAAMTLNA